MKKVLDLSAVSTPQLRGILKVLEAGIPASAEEEGVADEGSTDAQLCHDSPPKGYPEEKAQYGDPECYRYPLNTKARALAAWRYVHQADNKSILGDKFKKVESKIRSYAKKHYDLDLQTGESEDIDWEKAFSEYYDAETSYSAPELDPEKSDKVNAEEVKNIMEDKEKIEALERENEALKGEKETWSTEKAELVEKASQIDALTQELKDHNEELETLRKFKADTDEAAERAERLKAIKSQLEEAEVEADVEADADYWLSMTEETLAKTIAKFSEYKKGSEASASITVPPVGGSDEDESRDSVLAALKERKDQREN